MCRKPEWAAPLRLIKVVSMWVDIDSTFKGILYMKQPNSAKWSIAFLPRKFWFHLWTPKWHKNRGPYLTCGLWIIAIYRGY